LAQGCTAPKPSSSASWPPSPFNPPRTPTRPPLNRSKSSSYLKPTSRGPRKSPTNEHLSTADAQLFLKLPEKVQRRHFTQDEQHILAGHREEVILDATDAALYRLGRQRNRSVPSLRPSSSSRASTDSSLYFEAEQDPVDSAVDMDDAMLDNFRWMDNHDHLDLTLDDYHYHLHVAEAAGTKSPSDRRPSFHKNVSLSAIPLHDFSPASSCKDPSTRTASPNLRTSLEKSHQRHISRASTVNFLPIHHNRTSTDLAARYYQDPEARLKVRVYLASPSKFDEAVEFGFPPLSRTASRPSLSTRRCVTAPANSETFFHEDSPSLFNALDTSDDEDSASLPDLDPTTLSSAVFQSTHRLPSLERTSNGCNDLRSSLKPRIRYLSPEPYCPPTNGAREMTLRMTLTRPGLRTREERRGKPESDPLALDELPPARNGRTIWDSVPKEKGWKRMWRRVSGKSAL